MQKLKFTKFKGLNIYCNQCKSLIHTSKNTNSKCNHPNEKQRYKAVFKKPYSGGKRVTRVFITRELNEAIRLCLDLQDRIKFDDIVEQPVTRKNNYLVDCCEMYIEFLHNVGVPEHLQITRSKEYVKTRATYLNHFTIFLKNILSIDRRNIKLQSVNANIVGKYFKYLNGLNQSAHSFNARIKALSGLYSYLIDELEYDIDNPWKRVPLKPIQSTNCSISKKDFYDLIEIIKPENAVKVGDSQKRNMSKPYLSNLFKLMLFTGRRHEEVVRMKWNMIHVEDDKPMYLASPNLKHNRYKGIDDELAFEEAYVPIGQELTNLLIELGMDQFIGVDKYIISSNGESRKTMEKNICRRFKFFFEKLNRDYNVTAKYLRKTYINRESKEIPNVSVQHTRMRTTSTYYLDRKLIAMNLVQNGFRVFD